MPNIERFVKRAVKAASFLALAYLAPDCIVGNIQVSPGKIQTYPEAYGQPIGYGEPLTVYRQGPDGKEEAVTIHTSTSNPAYLIFGVEDCKYVTEIPGVGRVLVEFPDLHIETGDPMLAVAGESLFGWDNTDPDNMRWAAPFRKVRISGETEHLGTGSDLDRAMVEAKKYGLEIIFVFHDNHFLTEDEGGEREIRRRVRELIMRYDDVIYDTDGSPKHNLTIQVNNEGDSKKYWEGDLDGLAKYMAIVIKEARLQRPNIRIILGAFTKLENIPIVMELLEQYDVLPDAYDLGDNVYGTIDEMKYRVKVFRQITGRNPIILETGIQGQDKSQIFVWLRWLFEQGIYEVYVYKLVDHDGWGYITPNPDSPNGRPPGPDDDFCQLLLLSQGLWDEIYGNNSIRHLDAKD